MQTVLARTLPAQGPGETVALRANCPNLWSHSVCRRGSALDRHVGWQC